MRDNRREPDKLNSSFPPLVTPIFRSLRTSMSKPKLIEINLGAAKELVRILKRNETSNCVGCDGELHQADCPAKEMFQLRNYLTQRINNPNRKFGI